MAFVAHVLLLALIIAAFGESKQEDALKVSVYYESYCPDSINFIQNQLAPLLGAFNAYPSWLTLDLLPFGKAKKAGKNKYDCQHGPKECKGNKLEACAINELVTTQYNPLYMRLVNFIYCTMTAEDQIKGARECAAQTGVDYKELMKCYHGPLGNKLINMYANRTAALQPALTWVPTVVFNDVFNQTQSDAAQKNLYEVVCTFVPDQCV